MFINFSTKVARLSLSMAKSIMFSKMPKTMLFDPKRFYRSAQQTASPMFTAIMSGRVGVSGRELLICAEHLAIVSTFNFIFYEFCRYMYYLKL